MAIRSKASHSKGAKMSSSQSQELAKYEVPGEVDELKIGQGGLYAAMPIPAYRLLAAAKEYIAQDVLMCLVSHLGKGNRRVLPSISLMVKKYQFWEPGKKRRNIYYLQEACWNNDQMNREALAFAPVIGRCGCGERVKLGEIGVGMNSFHHYGCGDIVTLYSTRVERKQLPPDINTGQVS
jgi:hypothetical protein